MRNIYHPDTVYFEYTNSVSLSDILNSLIEIQGYRATLESISIWLYQHDHENEIIETLNKLRIDNGEKEWKEVE